MSTTFKNGPNKGKTTKQVAAENTKAATMSPNTPKGTPSGSTMTQGMNNAQLANQMMATGGTSSPLYQQVQAQNNAAASSPEPLKQKLDGGVSYTDMKGNQIAASAANMVNMNTAPVSLPSMSSSTAVTSNLAQPSIGQRLMNSGQVLEAAFNPLSKNQVIANTGNATADKIIGTLANHPYQVALAATGLLGLIKGAGTALAATQTTKVATLSKVGVAPAVDLLGVKLSGSTAGQIAVNTLTKAKTATWLTKLAATTTNPTFVVGTLMAAIGSYPFAGFIKEEALQTLGFATKTALDNDDLENAQMSNDMTKQILNPDMWNNIKAGIPFVNVLANLDDFIEASKVKVIIDDKVIDDRRREVETTLPDGTIQPGESTDEKWARVRQEQSDEERANIDYYNSERQKLLEWERQAAIAGRDEDAAFWRKEHERQSELEAADRAATAKFWEAYRKASQKASEDARPSKLNFGII